MRNFEQIPPLVVTHASGAYIETDQGKLIDAISSWWCKPLGHGHPAILEAIRLQLQSFEHVIAANTTHSNLAALGEALAEITGKQHLFFASDGACAVEIALKLAIQAMKIKGYSQRNQVIALQHAYHGETLGALSVSDIGLYKEAWAGLGIHCHFLGPIPYLNNNQDPLWVDAEEHWLQILPQLEALRSKACAIIVEPMIQGAHGFRPYSADFLAKLAAFAKQHDIYLIADEIMTGLGRTGTWLACEHAGIEADMICLSKGLTAGSIPFSCVSIDHAIYDLFYTAKEPEHQFLHSHTYSGNALGVAAALATLTVMRQEQIDRQAEELGRYMLPHFSASIQDFAVFSAPRNLGAIVAADYLGPDSPQFDQALTRAAQVQGALLRPMGRTLYWFPPLNTSREIIDDLATITRNAIATALREIK